MASGGIPQVIGSVLGAAFKELIRDPPTNNTERSASANWNRNGRQNFKKNTRHFNSNNDVHSKKVVKTLEKLVDTKDEALTQEMIRRRKAEQEVRELQQKLEKVQVTKEQAEKKDATSRKFNPHWRSEGKGGSGRGGYNKWGRGGYNTSNRGDGQLSNHACPFKFNNNSNVESERRDNKVYNKQLFDVSAGACKMNNSTYPDASNFPQFHGPMNARGGPHNIHYRRIRSENRDQKLKQKKDKVEGKAYGNKEKEAYSTQKGKKGKSKNDEETGEVSSGEDALQIFLKADIPTEEEIRSKNISLNQPVNEFTLVAKDMCFVPSTVGDMISFKKKYPDAKAILVKDEDDI